MTASLWAATSTAFGETNRFQNTMAHTPHCSQLADQFNAMVAHTSPAFRSYISNSITLIMSPKLPETACRDADTYWQEHSRIHAIQRKIVEECDGVWRDQETGKVTLDRNTIDEFYAQDERQFLENRRKMCQTAAPVGQVRRSASTGGDGGSAFDDASAGASRPAVTGITVVTNLNPADHHQPIIGSLQVEWGDVRGDMHGGKGPLAQPSRSIQLWPDEVIRKVEISSMSYNFPATPAPVWVAGLRIVTNVSTYVFGNMGPEPSIECTVPDGEALVGFYGRAGSYIDRLGCVMGARSSVGAN